MKVNKIYKVRAYNATSKILLHEYYTSLKEAKSRMMKLYDIGYEVIDDFKIQEKYTYYLSMVCANPTDELLDYFKLVKEGQFDDVRILKKGGYDELQ